MPYIFGKLWHLAIIWAIRKAFQCILQGVRFLLANHTRLSPTSENESYMDGPSWSLERKKVKRTSLLVTFCWYSIPERGRCAQRIIPNVVALFLAFAGLLLTWNSTFTAAYWQNDGLVLTSSIICQDFKKEDGSFERSSASQHSGNDVREAT